MAMPERLRIWLGRGLVLLGMGLLVYWLGVTLDGRAFQAGLARRLESLGRLSRTPSALTVARLTRREARTSGLVGRLEIPRLGISAIVVEGTTGSALRHGIGHVERTAFPGERGNVGLAGHRDTYFRKLEGVSMGDLIRVHTPDGRFAYQVDSILIVDRDREDLLDGTNEPRLTLVTCYPFYYVGPAPRRFVIRAHPAGPRS